MSFVGYNGTPPTPQTPDPTPNQREYTRRPLFKRRLSQRCVPKLGCHLKSAGWYEFSAVSVPEMHKGTDRRVANSFYSSFCVWPGALAKLQLCLLNFNTIACLWNSDNYRDTSPHSLTVTQRNCTFSQILYDATGPTYRWNGDSNGGWLASRGLWGRGFLEPLCSGVVSNRLVGRCFISCSKSYSPAVDFSSNTHRQANLFKSSQSSGDSVWLLVGGVRCSLSGHCHWLELCSTVG